MRPRIPILAAALLVAATAAQATLTEAIPFDKKVETSAAIILGKVVKTESRWDESHSRILTYTTFRVDKSYKGQPLGDLTLVTPGGQVGDVQQATIGVPTFREGDENVVFVRQTKAGATVSYFDQGAYAIVDRDNERYVQPVETNAVRIDTQRGVAVDPEPARPLRTFESDVRDSMGRIAAERMELIERQKKQRNEASLWGTLSRNRALIALALIGAVLATWQLTKRQ
ncbi:MAG TPA: hypothetical protein VFN10_08420 [Thermoanaerobaculia bacterium]|nr:hypothetical protein [Thermoanaerobaculia bacterium]